MTLEQRQQLPNNSSVLRKVRTDLNQSQNTFCIEEVVAFTATIDTGATGELQSATPLVTLLGVAVFRTA